jgi:hypothetical protein
MLRNNRTVNKVFIIIVDFAKKTLKIQIATTWKTTRHFFINPFLTNSYTINH